MHWENEKVKDKEFLGVIGIKIKRKKGIVQCKKLKKVGHEIFKGEENTVDFEEVIPTMNPKFFLIHYMSVEN